LTWSAQVTGGNRMAVVDRRCGIASLEKCHGLLQLLGLA
jgi:hypothetical protein